MERRSVPRRRTFLGGVAVFNHRQSSMDCILRDLGGRGARLAFAQPPVLPDEFDLQVPRLGRAFRVRVSWRSRDAFGVAFLDEAAAPASDRVVPLDHAIRIRELERDNRRLRQRVTELSVG